ncbi:DUF1071 domain-containing protein [Macrococcoides caseolyticum]|uniref:Sak single strand annealing protein n=1 Tax=Macrococcoides caseolyticum TaxID=69966 RepID=UPI000C323007|nr:DUF1071 domain-containing protein [Macrococcus caseolyticus]PKF14039.1 DUF1071 domain-containing protein [Macrococcus caseolyticus]
MTESLFEQLNKVNVNDHVEQKNGLSYLSWSWAHGYLKKIDPDYSVKIHEFPHPDVPIDDFFVPFLKTKEGYFVQVSVTIKGKTETELLPVLDFRNKPVAPDTIAAFDINKAHKRCFVKAAALHGLGLYIYNGEKEPEQVKTLADDKDLEELQKKLDEAIKIGGDDATESKLLHWLKIEDKTKIFKEDLPAYIKKLEVLINSKKKQE